MDTDGGGWVVFQRRVDGSEDFFRTWNDYEIGFGNLSGEFWLGLMKIHRLTKVNTVLRVELEDFEGNKRFAKYATFQVQDNSTNYQLNVLGYSGDAGDSLSHHNGMQFTTRDRDNDLAPYGNCGQGYKGGWWYRVCIPANLNGEYFSEPITPNLRGIKWSAWKGAYYSLKFTEMKLR